MEHETTYTFKQIVFDVITTNKPSVIKFSSCVNTNLHAKILEKEFNGRYYYIPITDDEECADDILLIQYSNELGLIYQPLYSGWYVCLYDYIEIDDGVFVKH